MSGYLLVLSSWLRLNTFTLPSSNTWIYTHTNTNIFTLPSSNTWTSRRWRSVNAYSLRVSVYTYKHKHLHSAVVQHMDLYTYKHKHLHTAVVQHMDLHRVREKRGHVILHYSSGISWSIFIIFVPLETGMNTLQQCEIYLLKCLMTS